MQSDPETVLVVGATGNIGVSASQRTNVGSSEGIPCTEASVVSESRSLGTKQSVVDHVRAGLKLPAFQRVYSCGYGRATRLALYPVPVLNQGPLFSMRMATAASRENADTVRTGVRFNEVCLNGTTSASDFAVVYEAILARPEIRSSSSRVRVDTRDDMKELKYKRGF
ncbi:hypothetical protein C8R43DRAFT_1207035 [Mycena crocata]|nr:hypothetical protein C8R43DRAFT_1207035 [Mycena crocata]